MKTHQEILEQEAEKGPPKMGWIPYLLCLAVAGALGYYFYSSNDHFGVAVVALTLLGAMIGFRAGLCRILISLGAIGVAVYFAPSLGTQQEFRFEQWFGTTGLLNRFLAIATIGLLVSMIATGILLWISGWFLRNRPRLASMNAWMGFFAGGLQTVVAVLIFVGGLYVIEPVEMNRLNQLEDDGVPVPMASEVVLTVCEHAHDSELNQWIEKYNPFEQIPQLAQLKTVQKSVQVLSNPNKLNDLMNHPSIRELHQRPEVREAVNAVMEDPQITEILGSEGALNRESAMTLLSHPAILKLVDQPAFFEQASKLIQETSLLENVEI